jgi:hypothetical protein
VETDLMDESSRITSALNLARFLLIRDRESDRTSIYKLLKSSDYLYELQKALELSKAHYKLEINKLKQSRADDLGDKIDIQVGSEGFKSMPTRDEQVFALENAMKTFDLLESLRIRANELLHQDAF